MDQPPAEEKGAEDKERKSYNVSMPIILFLKHCFVLLFSLCAYMTPVRKRYLRTGNMLTTPFKTLE